MTEALAFPIKTVLDKIARAKPKNDTVVRKFFIFHSYFSVLYLSTSSGDFGRYRSSNLHIELLIGLEFDFLK